MRLSQNLSKPGSGNWILLKQVMRYIKGTMNYRLNYTKSENGLKLIGYSDADWASEYKGFVWRILALTAISEKQHFWK